MQQVRTEIRTADWQHIGSTTRPSLTRTTHPNHDLDPDRFSNRSTDSASHHSISIGRPIFINYLVLLFSLPPWIWSRLIALPFPPSRALESDRNYGFLQTNDWRHELLPRHEHLILLSMLLSRRWWSSWDREEIEGDREEKGSRSNSQVVPMCGFLCVSFCFFFLISVCCVIPCDAVHKIWTWI